MRTSLPLEVCLRRALNCLYDSVALGQSPLIDLLRLRSRPNSPDALRTLLESEIQSLADEPGAPTSSKNHRYYQVLFYRYIQRFTQQEVAAQLGIGTRHLRREQDAAIEYLAYRLRQHYDLRTTSQIEPGESATENAASAYGDIDTEIEHLTDSLGKRACELRSVLEECALLTRALAAQRNVTLQIGLEELYSVAVSQPILKQIILNVLTMAIRAGDAGTVCVGAHVTHGAVALTFTPQPAPHHAPQPITWDQHTLSITRRMARAFRGQVEASAPDVPAVLTLTLPLADRLRVLAIEDNQDTLDLWQRYLRDSPFHLIPLRSPHDALAEIERLQPDLIVLDIMMPEVDGWELLNRLREHRLGKSLPVVVCSVLPQRDLALSLGANGFLPKPATREQFLGLLQHLAAVAVQR
jgi:CheY-like chemotaxis protein